MTNPRLHNVQIIASGPAGLAAAIYAVRANLKRTCVEGFNAGGLIPGGPLMFTTEVEKLAGSRGELSLTEARPRAYRRYTMRQGMAARR